jgi:thioredoxin reductase
MPVDRCGMSESAQRYDVVVVGGGAAGLSGAVALARSRRSVLVIDAGQPRNAPADGVHNYLGREGAPPADLLADGRAELAGYGGQVVRGVVTAARREDDGDFLVTLDDGREVPARRLLVATGLVDELPELPGLAERWGRDVLHCPYCHGWEVRDRAIGILATGPNAVHQALLFRQLSDDVVFFRHTGPELPSESAEQLAALGVPMVDGEVTGIEVTDDRLTGVRLATGEVVPRAALVVAPRFTARAGVLESLGVPAVEQEMGGHVVGSAVPADPTGATAVPGVWVAGNVSDMSAQVVVSAAAGMRAGAMINADLVAEDARRAVDEHRSVAA